METQEPVASRSQKKQEQHASSFWALIAAVVMASLIGMVITRVVLVMLDL